MLESFKTPPSEYRIAPFWFWNFALDENEIERQIREMHAKGIGGFFIHGRFGLRTEYMGELWMRCIERACTVARQLDMHVYLYDENPFPSGVAGGEAMKDVRHYNKFLDISRQTVAPGETVIIPIPEGKLLSAVALDIEERTHLLDLKDYIEGQNLIWTAPADRHYEVLVFVAATARYKGFIYGSEPDYFESSLVDTFFAYTHERYATRLKPFLGTVIKGIFTDEPKIQCIYHMHEDGNTTAWFADLPEQFRQDHGYDLLPHLACLVTDCGPITGKVRRDFWTTVTNQYVERFFRRYRKWCEENEIALTGHLFLEEGLYANTMYQGNFPQVLSQFHIPGVDHLGLTAEGDYAIRRIPRSITRAHGQKLVSSTAHIIRAPRVLSETFGCCGWTLSMEHMKWIVDWQMSLGINFLCPHAFYYSLAGVRKTDAPPSQFYQAAYWPHYKLFADYTARLSYALSQGRHKAQIALLYPIKGFHSEWAPGIQGPIDSLIAEYFDIYCAYLLKEHIDYDILPEEAIRSATCVDQLLKIAGEEYELVIMPPTTALAYETALKLKEFVEDGGKVMATMLLPTEDADDEKHQEIRDLFIQLFGKDPVQLREDILSGIAPSQPVLTQKVEGAFFFEAPKPADLIPRLRDLVSKAIRPEVSVRREDSECYDVTYLHRTLDGEDLFFFSNNCDEPREVEISIRCDGSPYMLDIETGHAVALTGCIQQGSRTIFTHRFERYGSLLVYFGNEPALAVGRQAIALEGQEIRLGDEWAFRLEGPNSLTLRDWNLNILTQQEKLIYTYTTCFETEFVPDELMLVLDDMPEVATYAGCAGSSCRVFVNDRECVEKRSWIIDPGFQCLNIRDLIEIGTNQLKIVIDHGGWSGDPQLMSAEPRLMGSFSVNAGSNRLLPPKTTLRTGSWTEQGYPYFSGTGVYCQTVEIPEFSRDQRIVLRAEETADMVEFVVNGARAGVRPWPPFEIEITHLVKPGPNTVELRITNSLANLLQSEPCPSGLLSGATIIIY